MKKKPNHNSSVVVFLDESATFEDHLNFSQFELDNTVSSASDKPERRTDPKPKGWLEVYGWIVYSLACSFSYTAFNTMTATYVKEDCYSAKVVNCMVLGFAAMVYRGYKNFVHEESVDLPENQRIVSHRISNSVQHIWISVACGVLNFAGQMILTMALNEAVKSDSNLGIVSALLTGTLVLSLYASFFVYNEPITTLQASGSVFLLLGNSTLALFAQGHSRSQVGSVMMVVYALVAMMCFSVRVLISKRTCHAIGTPLYVELNFLTEFCLGLGMLLLWWQGALALSFETNRSVMLALASFF